MRAAADRKIVIVSRPTRLQGLVRRFGTPGQVKFMMRSVASREGVRQKKQAVLEERAEKEFADFEREQSVYDDSISQLRDELADLAPVQLLDREQLPTYLFGPNDLVITVGQDGLVANTAKYAVGLPIIGANPDPSRFDGILLPFAVAEVRTAVLAVMKDAAALRRVTLAEVLLSDGQRLLAFNDLFVGVRSHASARYTLRYGSQHESQSSSGVLISTGAGSTGWLSSVVNMTNGLAKMFELSGAASKNMRLPWDDPRLVFVVREPFVSRTSGAKLVGGMVEPKTELLIESAMPTNGVIFSDGVESDFLEFTAGTIARVRAAAEHATLVVKR